MKVSVFKDERTLAKTLAAQIAQSLADKPDLVLGLPTGRTPIRLYHELGSMHAKGQIDFARVKAFSTAAGSHGCCATSARRTPIMCMIGKFPVLRK